MDLTLASKSRLMHLNELAELRDGAYENTRIYKERTKKWHDSRLCGDKYFKVGDKVLLYNFRLKMYPGKLKSKWSGPNIVKRAYPYGAVEITERLKKYYGGNIDKEDDEVIEFENDDLAGKKSTKVGEETDIREKDEKSSKSRQNQAWNGKAWRSQSQIKAKVQERQSQRSKPEPTPKNI
ncbi:hypothetical protein Tco_1469820 [Tanacetum coccineum]